MAEVWTCSLCLIPMLWRDISGHLEEHIHMERAASTKTVLPIPPRAPWTCGICSRNMTFGEKSLHVSGRHALNTPASASKARPKPSPVGPVPTTNHNSALSQWKCIVCNLQMNQNSKQSHLAGKKHAAKSLLENGPEADPR